MRQVLLALVIAVLLGGNCAVIALAEENWREEFDRICARTGEAGKLSEAELNQLISDSERLREKIAGSNDPDSKVYLFRVGKCRDFFVFMKDTAVAAQRR
jgi:hypothetical protein